MFVPDWADENVIGLLASLGASVTRCSRRATDPPGDPAVLRFREAVQDGAIPFGVQGPDNALCLDGGRTIGWELSDATVDGGLDRVVVQVGGGALAACVGWGLGPGVRLDTVQTEGCAPLERAWRRAQAAGLTAADAGTHWGELMTPWDDPHSAADGILDDESYDWLGVFEAMERLAAGRSWSPSRRSRRPTPSPCAPESRSASRAAPGWPACSPPPEHPPPGSGSR